MIYLASVWESTVLCHENVWPSTIPVSSSTKTRIPHTISCSQPLSFLSSKEDFTLRKVVLFFFRPGGCSIRPNKNEEMSKKVEFLLFFVLVVLYEAHFLLLELWVDIQALLQRQKESLYEVHTFVSKTMIDFVWDISWAQLLMRYIPSKKICCRFFPCFK